MSIFTLISLILGIVEPVLSQSGVIPSAYKNLADGIVAAIAALKNELTGASGQLNITALTLLQAISAGVQALANAGALPAQYAGIASALSLAAAAGATEYAQSTDRVDPTTLKPISPASVMPWLLWVALGLVVLLAAQKRKRRQ